MIGKDRTGSGKTLAFVLPVLEQMRRKSFTKGKPNVLVLLPTRELCIQISKEF